MGDIFSITERGTYKRCRRKWDLGSLNRKALTPIKGTPSLALGSLVHKALEVWAINFSEGNTVELKAIFMQEAGREVLNIQERYRAVVGATPSDAELADVYEAIGIGYHMMENYQEYYGSPIPEGFQMVSPEQQLVVSVPGTEHKLEAKIDLLLEHVATGRYFILDHKTYKRRPRENAITMNDQFLGYTWVMEQVYPGRTGGFIYDGLLKKAAPSKDNSLEDLFLRKSVIFPPEQLDEFARCCAAELSEMGDPNTSIYPNRQWQGCWDCHFEELCTAISRGESWETILKYNFTQRERDLGLEDLSEED